MSGSNSPPAPFVQANGAGVITDAQLNSLVQGGMLLTNLQNFVALNGMTALMIGATTPGIGANGLYWFNSSSTATPDNINVIQPNGLLTGRWQLLPPPSTLTVYNVRGYGATGNGVTDDHAAIMAAESAAASAGGGIVYFPPGNYVSSAAISTTTSGVQFVGAGPYATTVTFNGTSSDWFTFIGSSSSQLNGCVLSDMSVTGVSVTGGRATYFANCGFCAVQRVYFNNCWNGSEWYITNTCRMTDVVWQNVNNPTGFGFYWHAPADGSARSDQMSLTRTLVQGAFSGANGYVVDGMCDTFNCWSCTALHCNYGWQCNNSAGSTQYYPSFWELSNCGTDGIKSIGVQINGGNFFNFMGCEFGNTSGGAGQGSNDTNAIQINPDAAGSVTRGVTIIGGTVGNCKGTAISVGAYNTTIIGTRVYPGTTATPNTVPAIHVTSTGNDTVISGITAYVFGDQSTWNYGVQMDSGSKRTLVGVCNFAIGCATAPYLNNSADADTFINNIITGSPAAVNQKPIFSGPPANPQQGWDYYDSSLGTARYYTGSAWVNYP